jgi:hypothetical protein
MGRTPNIQKRTEINNKFSQVLLLVEKGLTIGESLKKLNIHSGSFYKYLSIQQKMELQLVKTANAKYQRKAALRYG